MTDTLVRSIVDAFSSKVPKEFIVFVISMIPVLELRGSILAAGVLKMNFPVTYVTAVIGNMLPIPFILLFIDKIFAYLKTTHRFKGLAERLEQRAISKSDSISRLGALGLFLFVAIPLPGTGAWTGALAASLLRFKTKTAFLCILAGVMCAGLIMSLIAFGVIAKVVP